MIILASSVSVRNQTSLDREKPHTTPPPKAQTFPFRFLWWKKCATAFVRLTPTFVWSPRQSVSGLPGPVVVQRSAALAVITCSVVSAHTLPMNLRERGGEKELISNKKRKR